MRLRASSGQRKCRCLCVADRRVGDRRDGRARRPTPARRPRSTSTCGWVHREDALHQGVSRVRERPSARDLPAAGGLDGVDVDADGTLLFSVGTSGVVTTRADRSTSTTTRSPLDPVTRRSRALFDSDRFGDHICTGLPVARAGGPSRSHVGTRFIPTPRDLYPPPLGHNVDPAVIAELLLDDRARLRLSTRFSVLDFQPQAFSTATDVFVIARSGSCSAVRVGCDRDLARAPLRRYATACTPVRRGARGNVADSETRVP